MKKPPPVSSSASGDDFRLVSCVNKINLCKSIILFICIILSSYFLMKYVWKRNVSRYLDYFYKLIGIIYYIGTFVY